MSKPLTQREIKQQKRSKAEEPKITVENLNKRILTLQLRDQNSDFYVGERSVQIGPHKTLTERESLFNAAQLSNLKAKGQIRVVGGIA
jgi:hypothetical protein